MKHWSIDEINWFVENYPLLGKSKCALHLTKTIGSIRSKASRLGLKQNKESQFFKDWQERAAKSKVGKKRPEQAKVILELHKQGKLKMTDERKKTTGKRISEYIKTNGHPKGMKGKIHSDETKEAISESSKKIWANPSYILNQDEYRQTLSDRASLMQRKGLLRNGYSRGSQGQRADLGNIFFRSSWEANYARYLNYLISKGIIYKWEFEPDTFWFESIKRGVRSYLPDFKIWDSEISDPYYVEVKGWMDDKSKTKLKRMNKYYPNIRVDLVCQKTYRELQKKMSKIIRNWE